MGSVITLNKSVGVKIIQDLIDRQAKLADTSVTYKTAK